MPDPMTSYPFSPVSTTSLESLRRRIVAGLRERVVIDSAGRVSHMVWIPRFKVPANLIKEGQPDAWPASDLQLGGFYVDKYLASRSDATHAAAGSGTAAVSVPGVVAWTNLRRSEAATALAQRTVNGVACRLPYLEEWGALVLIGYLLGFGVRGNTNAGKDARDADSWERRGTSDPTNVGATLTGTGPQSWSINGLESGPCDVLGNVHEWINDTAPGGRLTLDSTAQLDDAGGIAASDLQLTFDGVDAIDEWPTVDGVIRMEDALNPGTYEVIKYSTLADNGDGTYTLGGLTRGHRGTTALNHADDRPIELLGEYCVVPKSVSFFVEGLVNVTDPVTFTAHDEVVGYGKAGDGIQIGDTIQVELEQLTVTGVAGDQITATRGANGTTPAPHNDWTLAQVHPAGITKVGAETDPQFLAFFDSFRADGELGGMLLPSSSQTLQVNAEAGDQFNMRLRGGAIARGGYHGSGGVAESGFELTMLSEGDAWPFIGFRGVLPVQDDSNPAGNNLGLK